MFLLEIGPSFIQFALTDDWNSNSRMAHTKGKGMANQQELRRRRLPWYGWIGLITLLAGEVALY